MRAKQRLLEYLIHMWDSEQQVFHVGVHVLSLDIEDIYFLTRFSSHGARVTLTGGRSGGFPMSEYIHRHCEPDAKRRKGKVAIRCVRDLTLRTILFTISLMEVSAPPDMELQSYFQYDIECLEPRVFNWCDDVLRNMKIQLAKSKNGPKTVRLWVHFSIFLLRKSSTPMPTTGMGNTRHERPTNENMV